MIQVSQDVLACARKRGISLAVLSGALGVSKQAVDQRLKAWERRTGERLPRHSGAPHRGRMPFVCPVCKNSLWLRPGDPRKYCSQRCYGRAQHVLTGEQIQRGITLRERGYTWTRTAHSIGTTTQCLQQHIWRVLGERGQLNDRVLKDIWDNGGYPVPASWRWILNKKLARAKEPSDDLLHLSHN